VFRHLVRAVPDGTGELGALVVVRNRRLCDGR